MLAMIRKNFYIAPKTHYAIYNAFDFVRHFAPNYDNYARKISCDNRVSPNINRHMLKTLYAV